MKICFSTSSIWFDATVVSAFGVILIWLIKYSWGFSFLLSTNTTKKKKRSSRKKKLPQTNPTEVSTADDSPPNKDAEDRNENSLCEFSYKSLVDATQDFLSIHCMHYEDLGGCFRGKMLDKDGDIEHIVIRRFTAGINRRSTVEEFMNELFLLSQANHPNLAKLIGYCVEQRFDQRFLIYEYTYGGGTLEYRLRGDETCLDWKQRMKIVLGVAKALEYLQTIMKPPILHCYLKPANIMLDEDDNPKLYCSGMIRMYPSYDRVRMRIEWMGAYGYGWHDYRLNKEVTLQADIYGFGILLLEMITGKRGIFDTYESERQVLTKWVQPYFKGDIDLTKMVDSRIKGKFDHEELYEVCNIAKDCLEEQPSDRPLIANLVTRMNHLVG